MGSYLLTELMAPILVSSASDNNPSRVISVSSGGMYVSIYLSINYIFILNTNLFVY